MAEEEKQEGQKTLVAFVVGLLIGGMLVWAFSGSPEDNDNDLSDMSDGAANLLDKAAETGDNAVDTVAGVAGGAAATAGDVANRISAVSEATVKSLEVGEGEVAVANQPASLSVALDTAVYPVSEGWIGVQEYENDSYGFLLGVVRFSESDNLVPEVITLQRPTIAGQKYAIVIYEEDGDLEWTRSDRKLDEVFDTFTAE